MKRKYALLALVLRVTQLNYNILHFFDKIYF